MKYILLPALLLCSGCICLNPEHHRPTPPSVQTTEVIDSLKKLKTDLDQAGEDNASVDQKLERALTLAEKLGVILDQLESMFKDNKTTVKPE